jgi:MFS family permease
MLTLAVGSTVAGILIARLKRYQWSAILGGAILVIGTFLLTLMSASIGMADLIRNVVIVGIGFGMLQPVIVLSAQNAVPRSLLGAATGVVTYMRAMGYTLGTAVIGSVVNAAMRNKLATGIQHAFVATLIIVLMLLIITFFLKDVPLSQRTAAEEAALQQSYSEA